jgi:hypothetical protein
MKIACLGWGSLVWRPENLHVRSTWFMDGPLLPVEFARQSSDNRITLVLVPGLPVVRSLWAIMSLDDLEAAKKDLAAREGIRDENIRYSIGVWDTKTSPQNEIETEINRWAGTMGLDAVVWTSLKPRFANQERTPSADEVVDYLRKLSHEEQANATEYIRKAPRQIDTDYRHRIEQEFGWSPVSPRQDAVNERNRVAHEKSRAREGDG